MDTKKHRREKSDSKKRARQDEDGEARQHKKAKKQARAQLNGDEAASPQVETKKSRKKKADDGEQRDKKSKSKHKPDDAATDETGVNGATDTKKEKRKAKREKRRAEAQGADGEKHKHQGKGKKRAEKQGPSSDDVDAMDVDPPTAPPAAPVSKPSSSASPFCTQTVSLYIPFFPVGFDKPITNAAAQHLDPLLNHYSPTLRGVLLAYRNVNLSERPVRADPNHPPDDRSGAVLTSVDEYAVGFGWLTADLDLFIPRRGALMEGVVNLQSEGHVGVVCWDRFNASIEAKRLPRGWRWVDLAATKSQGPPGRAKNSTTPLSPESEAGEKAQAEGEEEEEEEGGEDEKEAEDTVEQMHTTGYWVDGDSRRVSGALRFRIKNFDVGLAGDFGYLSLEGTMLEPDEERALTAGEREAERKRREARSRSGYLRPTSRRVPEFSMTRFGKEAEEESQRAQLYIGSRPGTPDD